MLPEQEWLKQAEAQALKPSLFRPLLDDPQLPNLEGLQRSDLLEQVYRRVARDWPEFYGQTPDSERTFDLRRIQLEGETHYLPAWWPSQVGTTTLNPHQRVTWFQAAVRNLLPTDPSLISNKRELLLASLTALPILHSTHENGSLLTPDLL